MPGNRSLDEFVGGEEDDETAEPVESGREPEPSSQPPGGAATQVPAEGPDEAGPVEPMVETFAWSGTGGACASCRETVEERWRDGDDLVCADCKAW